MGLYTFFYCRQDSGTPGFEAHDLPDVPAAIAGRALRTLREHPSAAYVTVWDEDRAVGEFTCEQLQSLKPG